MAERLLDVEGLSVQFATEDGLVRAVDGVSFELERGQVLGIVGESGSGKSVTAMTIMGLTRGVNARFEGSVHYQGKDLLQISDTEMQDYRGNEIGMSDVRRTCLIMIRRGFKPFAFAVRT